jgi:antitoxin component YwqK of YwqJK toxin-antitoxin module
VKDKLHGECKAWHDNGQLCEQSTYVEGKLHGDCCLQ